MTAIFLHSPLTVVDLVAQDNADAARHAEAIAKRRWRRPWWHPWHRVHRTLPRLPRSNAQSAGDSTALRPSPGTVLAVATGKEGVAQKRGWHKR